MAQWEKYGRRKEKKKNRCKGIKGDKRERCGRERDRKKSRGRQSSSRINARTHARVTRGEETGGMASRRTANARAPGCSCEEFPSREKLDYLLEGRQQGFTHLLVLAFVLKHHHPILIQHCLGRHFFNNQFLCSRKSMYAGTRLLLVRYREMYIASSRKLPIAPVRLVPLRYPSRDLLRSTSTELN